MQQNSISNYYWKNIRYLLLVIEENCDFIQKIRGDKVRKQWDRG